MLFFIVAAQTDQDSLLGTQDVDHEQASRHFPVSLWHQMQLTDRQGSVPIPRNCCEEGHTGLRREEVDTENSLKSAETGQPSPNTPKGLSEVLGSRAGFLMTSGRTFMRSEFLTQQSYAQQIC